MKTKSCIVVFVCAAHYNPVECGRQSFIYNASSRWLWVPAAIEWWRLTFKTAGPAYLYWTAFARLQFLKRTKSLLCFSSFSQRQFTNVKKIVCSVCCSQLCSLWTFYRVPMHAFGKVLHFPIILQTGKYWKISLVLKSHENWSLRFCKFWKRKIL